MVRHLTLVLCGVVGSLVLAGNAEACHKRNCGCAPTVCTAPVSYVAYAPACAPAKHCGFRLPSLFHKRAVCAPTVACYTPTPVYYAAPVSYPAPGYPAATPQASMQR
jgi:hypothetical protein